MWLVIYIIKYPKKNIQRNAIDMSDIQQSMNIALLPKVNNSIVAIIHPITISKICKNIMPSCYILFDIMTKQFLCQTL